MGKNEEKKDKNKKKYITPDIEIITIEEDVITDSFAEDRSEFEGGYGTSNTGMFD